VQEHVPWAQKTLPIPPGICEKVIELIWKKIDSGVYEPSYSSYHHQWFTVAKKDRNICIIHNLTPLNAVTIHNLQEPHSFTCMQNNALHAPFIQNWTYLLDMIIIPWQEN